jgi:hypothetical protein
MRKDGKIAIIHEREKVIIKTDISDKNAIKPIATKSTFLLFITVIQLTSFLLNFLRMINTIPNPSVVFVILTPMTVRLDLFPRISLLKQKMRVNDSRS